MRIRSSFALVGVAALLGACATVPTGPAVTVMPGSGKTFEAFQQDAADCQQYAQASLGEIPISGVAFAGIRGVQQVEVSVDGGTTWQRASLQPPLSDQTWVFWNWTWRPTAPGVYTIVARATDGTGRLQTEEKRGTVPNGATGWHEIKVAVK